MGDPREDVKQRAKKFMTTYVNSFEAKVKALRSAIDVKTITEGADNGTKELITTAKEISGVLESPLGFTVYALARIAQYLTGDKEHQKFKDITETVNKYWEAPIKFQESLVDFAGQIFYIYELQLMSIEESNIGSLANEAVSCTFKIVPNYNDLDRFNELIHKSKVNPIFRKCRVLIGTEIFNPHNIKKTDVGFRRPFPKEENNRTMLGKSVRTLTACDPNFLLDKNQLEELIKDVKIEIKAEDQTEIILKAIEELQNCIRDIVKVDKDNNTKLLPFLEDSPQKHLQKLKPLTQTIRIGTNVEGNVTIDGTLEIEDDSVVEHEASGESVYQVVHKFGEGNTYTGDFILTGDSRGITKGSAANLTMKVVETGNDSTFGKVKIGNKHLVTKAAGNSDLKVVSFGENSRFSDDTIVSNLSADVQTSPDVSSSVVGLTIQSNTRMKGLKISGVSIKSTSVQKEKK